MKLMEEVKGHSSKWVKTKGNQFSNFYWQNGYGATKYIRNQREHHSGQNFQDEYRLYLEENEMEFDEKYVWE